MNYRPLAILLCVSVFFVSMAAIATGQPASSDIPKTPWGGSYQILPDSYKVCISENHPRVPEKYKHGGIAEIGRVYLAGEEGAVYWWK